MATNGVAGRILDGRILVGIIIVKTLEESIPRTSEAVVTTNNGTAVTGT